MPRSRAAAQWSWDGPRTTAGSRCGCRTTVPAGGGRAAAGPYGSSGGEGAPDREPPPDPAPARAARAYPARGRHPVRVRLTARAGTTRVDAPRAWAGSPATPQIFVGAGDIA